MTEESFPVPEVSDAEEEQELRQMWDTLCFEPSQEDTLLGDGVVCTEPRGHAGGHVCSLETLDRYHYLRRKVPQASKS